MNLCPPVYDDDGDTDASKRESDGVLGKRYEAARESDFRTGCEEEEASRLIGTWGLGTDRCEAGMEADMEGDGEEAFNDEKYLSTSSTSSS